MNARSDQQLRAAASARRNAAAPGLPASTVMFWQRVAAEHEREAALTPADLRARRARELRAAVIATMERGAPSPFTASGGR